MRMATCNTDTTDSTYHSLLSESTDLLDSPGGPLLEANAVDLYPLY
jgi:hypothetical protein